MKRAVHSGPLIRMEDVERRFGSAKALDAVSLDIAEGEFFCLLGPSGSGKSTLLRLIGGFDAPDRGRILLAEHDLSGVPPERRPVNTVFQSYALFPHMSVARNVAYGLVRAGHGRGAIAARVTEMLRLVRLEGLAARHPAQLSGGERQRVALARALARNPRVLLLDEPLAALDRRLREETGAELKAIQARLGTTFVMVTHDQGEALALADRIAVMAGGRVRQVGTPREVYDRPASRFVAEFIGTADLATGTVIGEAADGLALATPLRPDPVVVARPGEGTKAPGATVDFAVRPERVRFGADEPNACQAEVVGLAFEGAVARASLRMADGSRWQALRLHEPGTPPLAAGERVHVGFDAAAAIILGGDP